MSKRKGTVAEREVVNMFWAAGWAAIRSAGSGSMHFPSPDILAANKLRVIAIESKKISAEKKYLSEEDVSQLLNFSKYFGAEAWFAIKFPGRDWVFVSPEDLEKTKTGYAFGKSDAENKGLSFSELIEG